MKMQKFRIQHATATPKPQLKRHMRDAIQRALNESKVANSFAAFMRQACDAPPAELAHDHVTDTRACRPDPSNRTDPGQQERPAVQQK
ncbi:hypothetical protein HT749_12415 [Burkholderia cepacia]|uniref:hypothetical protein n=1 Tax=Burkholderia cepacia complex TaxID=87882 RepID=UPI000A4318DC|nr:MULTISPECIES: hypothetical protein [Burkholderia cepacia complex]NTX44207.1 hypothetical protein [Burkholderia cepacia]